MREKLVFLFLNFCLISCAQIESNKDFKAVELNEFYQSSGTQRYFLPALPAWANFSESAACLRKNPITFFDLDLLMKEHGLNYNQAIQLQYLFNISKQEKMESVKANTLLPKDDEALFFEALQKIQAGFLPFVRPKFSRVHLIWLDPYVEDSKKLTELKKKLKADVFNQGEPFFFSLCLSKKETEDFLERSQLSELTSRFLSSEILSVMNHEGKRFPHYLVEMNALFEANQKLHLYLFGETLPRELKGQIEVH